MTTKRPPPTTFAAFRHLLALLFRHPSHLSNCVLIDNSQPHFLQYLIVLFSIYFTIQALWRNQRAFYHSTHF